MRILLDCRFQQGAGPNIATSCLLDGLIKLNTRYEFLILQHHGQSLPDYRGIRKIKVPSQKPLFEFLWVQLCLPVLLKLYNIDICHSLKHVGPLFTSVPTALHLHAVGHFFPEGQEAFKLSLHNRIYWNHILVWGLKRASHIFGVSRECKTVITQKFGIPEHKVSVIYNGFNQKFKVIQDSTAISEYRRSKNLPEKYILCVGNLYPHKNYETVVRMFKKLVALNEESPKLVIVGDTSFAKSEFHALIRQLGIESHIVFMNYVDQEELVYIYNGALLFLFPPIVESFGIPLLESMACGIPVVASDRGAIAEVAGGAALLLENPRDEEEMLAAVRRVTDAPKLRKEMQQKGFQRVKDFSWDASAAKVLQLYESIGRRQNVYLKNEHKHG
jgi:glycosyltransferase involved in cell wall biosynthesis